MADVTPDIREEQDAAYSPEALKQRELAEAHSGGEDTPNPDEARQAEENPAGPAGDGGYANNFTGKLAQKGKKGSFLKRRGPIIAIGGGLGIGGFALLFLLVPGILLFHLLANMFNTYDPSSTALAQVTKIMILNKLGASADAATKGSCNIVTIACKFKTPTNEMLDELKQAGITPLDADGNPINIDLSTKWASEVPAKYEFSSFYTNSGESTPVKAADLESFLRSETSARTAFDKVVNKVGVRAFSRMSPAFLKTMDKLGFGLTDKLTSKINDLKESASNKVKSFASDLLDKAIEAVFGEGSADAAKAVKAVVAKAISGLLTKLDHVSKGSGAVLALAVACMVSTLPAIVSKALASFQQQAEVNMAAPVVTSISAIKAGDGSPETASELGTLFTETDSNGKSALDSAGIKYGLGEGADTKDDPTYDTVSPAAFGDLGTALNTANAILNNPVSATQCAILSNPIGGAAEAAVINGLVVGFSPETLGGSFVASFVIGAVASLTINTFGSNVASWLGDMISPQIGNLAQPAIQAMTTPGETQGNVFAAGVNTITATNGAQTFGSYLTTNQLTAYTQQTQAQEVADAQIDQATLSPFDPSSPYTFLGNIMDQLSPYYSSFASIGGALSTLGSLLPISFGSILNLSTANADTVSPYANACPNPDLLKVTSADGSTEQLAGTINCLPIPATMVPSNWDPNQTLDTMESMQTNGLNEIDPNTGVAVTTTNPVEQTGIDLLSSVTSAIPGNVESYSDWLDTCTDLANATDCPADNTDTQNYSLYNAALVDNAILDDDPSEAAAVAGTDGSSDTSASLDTSTDSSSGSTSADSGTTTSYVDSSVFQLVGYLGSLVSPVHQWLQNYGAASIASVSQAPSLASALEGFSLWG